MFSGFYSLELRAKRVKNLDKNIGKKSEEKSETLMFNVQCSKLIALCFLSNYHHDNNITRYPGRLQVGQDTRRDEHKTT